MAVALARKDPAPAASADAVVCERVTVRFTTERGTVTALENIDLTIPRGSFLTLLGPLGLRKVDPAARDGRPDRSHQRADRRAGR